MFAENHRISLRQMQGLLLLDCFGTAVLFLPTTAAQIGGNWLTVLLGSSVFVLSAQLLAHIGRKMPHGTAVEWFRTAFGGIWGTVLLFGLGGKLLFDGSLELRLLSEVISYALLPATPVWVISLCILLTAGALAVGGLECRGRCAELLFFVTAVPLVLLLLAVAFSVRYDRLLPLGLPTPFACGEGILQMSLVFQGLPFLYFVFPALKKTEKAPQAVCVSSLLTTAVVAVILLLCLAAYGTELLSAKWLSPLQMLERVSLSGIFLTRQDVLLLWFWTASGVVFLSGTVFYTTLLGTRLRRASFQKKWLLLCMLFLFAASLLPKSFSQAYHLRLRIAPWLHLFYLILVPLLLLFFCGKGGKRDA